MTTTEETRLALETQVEFLHSLIAKASDQDTRKFLDLRQAMLRERLSHYCASYSKKPFKKGLSATNQYLINCVQRFPGITRKELAEKAAIPGSPNRSDVDVFRDCLRACRSDIFIDAELRCWPRNGQETPVAKVGHVFLDGRTSPNLRKALILLKDQPGLTKEQIKTKLKFGAVQWRTVSTGLRTRTFVDTCGRHFIIGYIPSVGVETAPTKEIARRVEGDLEVKILDQMDFGTVYDWSEIANFFRELGYSAKEGYKLFNNMVASNLVHKNEKGYMRIC